MEYWNPCGLDSNYMLRLDMNMITTVVKMKKEGVQEPSWEGGT